MDSLHRISHSEKTEHNGVWWTFLWFAVASVIGFPVHAAPIIALFDTGSRISDRASLMDRSHWTPVPGDLLKLEADPVKSASDPGYYGREYAFKGDAVVENRNYLAVFWATQGRVTIYAPTDPATLPVGKLAGETLMLGRVVAELTPLAAKTPGTTISRCEIVRNVGDEVVVEAFFSANGVPDASVMFSFGKTEIVEVKPSDGMKGIRVLSPIEYGVAPNFVGDDLIFGPAEYPTIKSLTIPANNILVGLLRGEDHELVMTWPPGKQDLRLGLGADTDGKRHFEAIEFEAAGQSFYLALLSAHGIWHREALTPAYLEKDVTTTWQRPFPAKWVTQLDEAGVRTTFTFRDSKAQIWRGVPGSYNYPVWFTGGQASYHLSKKVPPAGESLVYFVEGAETPSEISAPVDILKATLGRATAEALVDVTGRKLRTHHRRGGDGVRRACTCGATEAIQAVFEAGEQVSKNDYVCAAVDDMTYFVERHVQRIEEYRRFADDLVGYLRIQDQAATDLKPYLAKMIQIVQQISTEYNVQKDNMKSLDYARGLAKQTVTLAGARSPENVQAYLQLGKDWRAMGGAQDYVLAQCHAMTRKLFQEAGYGVATQPGAADVALEIRARARRCLRNPDGYEIWANY